MKCYNHHETDTVGICKSCNKGVCSECAVDVGNGIACKNSCEEAVTDINDIMLMSKKICQRRKDIYKKTNLNYYLMAVTFGIMGFSFIISPFFVKLFLAKLLIPFGILSLIGMIYLFVAGMNWKSTKDINSLRHK